MDGAMFATQVVERLRRAGFESLFAGGCVRDLLMGQNPGDYDVATNARPEQVRQLFGNRQTLAVGAQFGVIVVLGPKGTQPVEVATFRTEGAYLDGRRPESVAYCSAEEDALRRDFTINGMFYDPLARVVHDYVGGQADLQRRVVRAIGNARDRFAEDKLRLLRAVRFAARFEFELDADTAQAIRELAPAIRVVSAERISQELKKMLAHPHRAQAMHSCRQLNLLAQFLPEAMGDEQAWARAQLRLAELQSGELSLGLACLLLDVPAADIRHTIGRRLKLANDDAEEARWLVEHVPRLTGLSLQPLHVIKPLLSHPAAGRLLELRRVCEAATPEWAGGYNWAHTFLAEHTLEQLAPPPLITGADLIGRGMSPGPQFKRLLDQIRCEQLDERLINREMALQRLPELLPQPNAV